MSRLSALAAAAALSLTLPLAANAQEAPAAAPAAAPYVGLTPEQVHDWFASLGVTLDPVTREGGDTYFRVNDGNVVWFAFFYGCQADGRCSDMQLSTIFDGAGVSLESVNAFNRDRRWAKAFTAQAQDQSLLFLQQDVLIPSGGDVTAMADPMVLWLQSIEAFYNHLQSTRAPATPAS